MYPFKRIFISAVSILITITSIYGQNGTQQPKVLTVGLYNSPPFVMNVDGNPKGMAVELWESVALNQNLTYRYQNYDSFTELVEATASNKIDVAVTNLTVTEDRARAIDFTHPWYDAGLRIMIGDDNPTSSTELIKGLQDAGHLRAYLWLLFIIVVVTVGFTLFDRKFDREFPRKWREGLAESFYSVMVIATTGNLKRKNLFGWVGRIFSAFWLVIGIILLAYLTSSITSVMTTLSLSNEINGWKDLSNKKVGVLLGSVAESFAKEKGFDYIVYSQNDEAVKSLKSKNIDAIIGDAPVLEYYDFTNSSEPVKVVGKLFKPDKYGFGLRGNETLTKTITIEILSAQESGYLEELRLKYFGQAH